MASTRRIKSNSWREGYYPHPISHWRYSVSHPRDDKYLREFSCAIRNEPDWTSKILDREFLAEKFETMELGDGWLCHELGWDVEEVKFILDELMCYREYVEGLKAKGLKMEPDIDGVWRANHIISEEAREKLLEAAALLESSNNGTEGSSSELNGQVVNLVDPSLWPLISGRSVDLDGNLIESNMRYSCARQWEYSGFRRPFGYCDEFSWLPSEFYVSADGKETRIKSYINNLSSPWQRQLFYPILETIFTQFVPLFNNTLADLSRNRHNQPRTGSWLDIRDLGKVPCIRYDVRLGKWAELLQQLRDDENMTVRYLDFAEYGAPSKRTGRKDPRRLHPVIKHVKWQNMWSPPQITDASKLEGRNLKVVVKMVNAVLTPTQPEYYGLENHIVGTLNERVVATGIYFYAKQNITDAVINFRKTLYFPDDDEDDDERKSTSDSDDNSDDKPDYDECDTQSQKVGNIFIKEGMGVVFPNVLIHGLEEFELLDKFQSGHLKMLIFHLCEPSENHNIPTTSIIMPQQPGARAELLECLRREGPLANLPEEIFQEITSYLPAVVTVREAQEYRKEFMDETFPGKAGLVSGTDRSFDEYEELG
ncbi:hypothetical protein TWF481_004100 [Arthrobotrys musiformis]|uniref:DUF4246 domain-containing protein n=1 Tax=Arthrobotrys musiformis TaxID=47236 RepID=A0AAV9WIN1_9PEZI